MQIKKIILGAATAVLVGVILTGCSLTVDKPAPSNDKTSSTQPKPAPSKAAPAPSGDTSSADVKRITAETVTLICGLSNKSVILPSDVQDFRNLATEADSIPVLKTQGSSTGINSFADSLAKIQNVPLTDSQKSSLAATCTSAKNSLTK